MGTTQQVSVQSDSSVCFAIFEYESEHIVVVYTEPNVTNIPMHKYEMQLGTSNAWMNSVVGLHHESISGDRIYMLFRQLGTVMQLNMTVIKNFKNVSTWSIETITRKAGFGSFTNAYSSIYNSSYGFIFGIMGTTLFSRTYASQVALLMAYEETEVCVSFAELH